VELLGQDRDRLVGERLRERDHLAHRHELLDDVGHRHAQVLGDVLDGRAGVDLDRVGGDLRVGVQRPDGVVIRPATGPAAALAARGLLDRTAGAAAGTGPARGLGVDDDTAPGTARAALAGEAAAVGALAVVARRAHLLAVLGDGL